MANAPTFFFANCSFSIARIEFTKGKPSIALNNIGEQDIVYGKGYWTVDMQESGTVQNAVQSNNKQIIVTQIETYDVTLLMMGYEIKEVKKNYRFKKDNKYFEIVSYKPYPAVVKGYKLKLKEIEQKDITW